MKYEISVHYDDDFTKLLLTYLTGVLELYNQKAISGQDVWNAIRLFYPNGKIEGFQTSKQIDYILGLMSEIEWSRDDFPQTYPKSLKQLRSLLKKTVSRLEFTTRDQDGKYKEEICSIKVTSTE